MATVTNCGPFSILVRGRKPARGVASGAEDSSSVWHAEDVPLQRGSEMWVWGSGKMSGEEKRNLPRSILL